MSVRIFIGKNSSSVKKMVGEKIRHWQKKLSFFADFFSSYKVHNSVLKKKKSQIVKLFFKTFAILQSERQLRELKSKNCQVIYDRVI